MQILQPIVNVLNDILVWLTALSGNAGLGVILLTVLIRLVLHPLSRYSLRSMKKMQTLAPQIEVLRRKHKDNPQQMNIEVMNLYRSSGVNPLGGCLPMLLQLPVLFALFQVLRDNPLFANATFLGIPLDANPSLARMRADPILALIPILSGLTTFLQQRMTMTDPSQARLFIFMPIMIAWFSLSFPVGLSIYWIMSTVLAIAEYYIVAGRPTPLRPAPARRVGRSGSAGSTSGIPPVSGQPSVGEGSKEA